MSSRLRKGLAFALACASLAALVAGFVWVCADMIVDARAQAKRLSGIVNLTSADAREGMTDELRLTILLVAAFLILVPWAVWFWWNHHGKYAAAERHRGHPAAAVPWIARLFRARRNRPRGFTVLPPKK